MQWQVFLAGSAVACQPQRSHQSSFHLQKYDEGRTIPAAAARTSCADAGAVKTAAPSTTDSPKPEGKNVWAGVREGRALWKPHNLLVYWIEFPFIFHSLGGTHNFSSYESESFLIFGLSIETVADDRRGRPGIVCGVTGHK